MSLVTLIDRVCKIVYKNQYNRPKFFSKIYFQNIETLSVFVLFINLAPIIMYQFHFNFKSQIYRQHWINGLPNLIYHKSSQLQLHMYMIMETEVRTYVQGYINCNMRKEKMKILPLGKTFSITSRLKNVKDVADKELILNIAMYSSIMYFHKKC